jgi:threonine aldolase
MRQAGVLAAAGIIAIEEMTGRLDEDHANACRLAEGLTGIDGIVLNMDQVRTNMVFFRLADGLPFDGAALAGALREHHNVKINPPRSGNFRLVTHYWITPERVDTAVGAIREEMARLSAA